MLAARFGVADVLPGASRVRVFVRPTPRCGHDVVACGACRLCGCDVLSDRGSRARQRGAYEQVHQVSRWNCTALLGLAFRAIPACLA